jgi:hypothetical protein
LIEVNQYLTRNRGRREMNILFASVFDDDEAPKCRLTSCWEK